MGVRRRALALAVATMIVGLGWHAAPVPMRSVHDIVGDVLWAMMMTWLVAAVGVRVDCKSTLNPTCIHAGIALLACYAVEFSQLLHTPALDALRRTTIGALVLGTGFDARDLVAYAAGVAIAAMITNAATTRD